DLLEQGIQLSGGLQLLDQILARGPIVMLLLLVRHGHDCSVPLGTAYTDHLTRPAARVLALHQSMKARARLYADHLEQLATFFRKDPDVQGLLDEADVTALKVATGLRCTYLQAHAQVRDAHLAVEWMPHTFAHLRAGDLPEAWHHWLLRQVRRLTESQVRQVDADMAGVEIPSVSKATFDKHVGLAVARASADTPPSPPSKARDARIVDIDP